MEHILMSDVAQKIRNNNKDRVEEYTEKILDVTKPILDDISNLPKWDGAMIILIYCRMWNDFVTSYHNIWYWHTTVSWIDMDLLKSSVNDAIDNLW